jgi:hypothetical protein
MLPKEQESVWLGALPVIEHVPGPAKAGLIDQLTPVPPGSGSSRVTEVAVPVPDAEAFETATVKPIVVPALTVAASAVLVIEMAGASTVTVADACTLPVSFEAAAVAVLGYVPALPAVVPLATCTLAEAPGARLPSEQDRVWLGAEPVIEQVPGPV